MLSLEGDKGSYFLQFLFTPSLNPFPNDKFRTLPNCENLQTTILDLMKMAENSQKEQKTSWEKEKLLVTSNFSFSRSVFKRLVLQTR